MNNKKINQKPRKKPKANVKRKTTKVLIFTSVITAAILIAYNFGFIPIGLSARVPVGDYILLDLDSYKENYLEVSDIPNLHKIIYQGYGTDELADVVYDNYKKDLLSDGYSIEYEGTGYFIGKNFRYMGFLKGITAVGIIISSETSEEIGYKTGILYMTGNAFDFIPILNWYQNNCEENEFF